MALNWQTIEDAIRGWVLTASGLASDHVIWASQDGNKPSDTYITIKLGGGMSAGAVAETVYTATSGTPPVGSEITETIKDHQEFPVEVTCFTPGVTTGESTARALLSQVQVQLEASAIYAALIAAGIKIVDKGSFTYIPAILHAGFQGRGVLTVTLRVCETAVSTLGYIATVPVEIDIAGLNPIDVTLT